MRSLLLAGLLLIVVALVAGCEIVEAELRPATTDLRESRDAPVQDGGLDLLDPCTQSTEDRVNEVVGGQLAAFAEAEFEQAWEFSSQRFRSRVDVEEMRRIIEEGFPVALEASGHELGHCGHQGDVVSVVVAIEGRSGVSQMVIYELVLEGDKWRVDGAAPLEGTDDGTITV